MCYKKRITAMLLAVMLLLSCSLVPATAMEAESNDNDTVIARATGRLDHTLLPGVTPITDALPYAKGDTISYNCTYTPKSASLDFGVIAPDGLFYSLNCTSGSINKSLEVTDAGRYTLAIRNNENYSVKVTGTVRY